MLKKIATKYKIVLIGILLVTLGLSVFVGVLYPSLKFFIIIPIAMFTGFNYPYLLRDVVPVRNIMTYLTLSLFFGLLLNTFIIFILGLIGISISSAFLGGFISLMSLAQLVFFVFCVPEEKIGLYFKNFQPKIIDVLWMIVFFICFLFFVQICTEQFFPNWDNFTYWAIDSKYIFETGRLNGRSLDILQKFYLPFYPLQLSYVYFIYGEVVEQFSSLLTLLYGFIGLSVLSGYIVDSKKDSIIKNFLYFISLVGLVSFFLSLNTLVTQYADVFCAVLIMFYGIIVFANEPTKKSILLRVLSVVFISISLYFTKLAYAPISLLLIILYVLYDFNYFFSVSKKSWKRSILLFVVLVIISVFISAKLKVIDNIKSYLTIFKDIYIFSNERFLYLIKILRYLLNRIPEFILGLLVFLGGLFFFSKGFDWKDLKKMLLTFIVAFLPIGLYFFTMKDISNGSLLRYLSLVFYFFPYLLINISPEIRFTNKLNQVLVTFIFLCTSFATMYQIYLEYNFNWQYLPISGKYSNSKLLEYSFSLAEEVNSVLDKNTTVMLVERIGEDKLGNTHPPSLYIRYYLAEKSVGSQYEIPKNEWVHYILNYNPDYLLVLDYSGFWPPCDIYLEKGKNYLIKIGDGSVTNSQQSCFFSDLEIKEIN